MKAAQKPITPEQTDSIIGQLAEKLRRRLTGMLFSQAQELVQHPNERIIGPVTAALFESSSDDKRQSSVYLMQQDILVGPSGEYHALDCFADESIFTFDLSGGRSLSTFESAVPQLARRRIKVFSYRAKNWMLRFDEAIALGLGISEHAALEAVLQNSILSLRQVEELVLRSEKGEYILTRMDGVQNFFFVGISGEVHVCGITRCHKEMKWKVALYHYNTKHRFRDAQYFI